MQCIKNFISQSFENSLSYYFHTVFINIHEVTENIFIKSKKKKSKSIKLTYYKNNNVIYF